MQEVRHGDQLKNFSIAKLCKGKNYKMMYDNHLSDDALQHPVSCNPRKHGSQISE